MVVNMHHAKTNLSRLVERAGAGEEILIARSGLPVAKLVPYTEEAAPRALGLWRERVEIRGDFDELPDDPASALDAAR